MISRKLMWVVVLALFATPAAMASNTWCVDGVTGNDNNNCKSPQTACKTIGHAISLASSGDSIMVAPATYTENLNIGISMKISGSDAATTIVDGGDNGTVFYIGNTRAHVTLSKLTIQNGTWAGQSSTAGGITNQGTLTINNTAIVSNFGNDWGGGIYNSGTLAVNSSIIDRNLVLGYGGGINNSGTLTISNSAISQNRASRMWCIHYCSAHGYGGGIYQTAGTVTINNSTIDGNSAGGIGSDGGFGGAIASSGGKVIISNSTISGNKADQNCGRGVCGSGYGGGIYNQANLAISNSTISGNDATGKQAEGGNLYGSATLQNTIVAYSTSGGNCSGNITSNGYNLSSDGSCNFNGTGDMNNTDPKLGKLGNHGGPTQTIPLLSGSPAIDAGNPGGCTDGSGHLLKTDQRGYPRPDKEDNGIGCDMGAYERQSD